MKHIDLLAFNITRIDSPVFAGTHFIYSDASQVAGRTDTVKYSFN